MKICIIGALPESLVNFRGDLIRSLVQAGHRVTAMAAHCSSEQAAAIEMLGATFQSFPVQRNRLNPLSDVKTLLVLHRKLRLLNPDVVLAYTIKPVIWGGLAARMLPHVRFFALVSGLGFAFHGRGIIRRVLTWGVTFLYRLALRQAAGVIFQNLDNCGEFVAREIVSADRCSVVNGSGVDLERFSVRPLSESGIVFLMIGRLLGEKGFREFAKAAEQVKALYPQSVFRIIGSDDPSPDGIPIDEVRSWQEKGWIEYLGSKKDVRPYLSDCHVFVLPSYHEGMPRTVLEAMAMGRAIITTDAPGCRETVVNGENGYLVPIKTVDELVNAMLCFIKEPDLVRRMGVCSRRIAEEKYDVHRVNELMLKEMGI